VVVGSAIVHKLGELAGQPERLLTEIPAVVAQMRRAMDEQGEKREKMKE